MKYCNENLKKNLELESHGRPGEGLAQIKKKLNRIEIMFFAIFEISEAIF